MNTQNNSLDPQQTLNQWLETWLAVYKQQAVKPKTVEGYISAIRIIENDICSQSPIQSITEIDLQQLLNLAASNRSYSKATLSKVRSTLRQAFRPLIRQNVLSVDPTAELTIPLSPTKEVLPLTHQQQEVVEMACSHDPLGHLIIFLLETGLRKGEMMDLTWDKYNPAEPSIFVSAAKTPAGVRKVYLTSRANAIVRRQAHINEYIFNHTKLAPVTPTVTRRLVDRIRKASGVDTLACHVCRHTFVTRLCEKKIPAKAIAQIIGHAKVDYVLDIYAQMEADELRKAIFALEPDGRGSAIMGSELRIPVHLYDSLQAEADAQGISVDALVTHLLTLYVSESSRTKTKTG